MKTLPEKTVAIRESCGGKVLLIEDEWLLRWSIERVLSKIGYHVIAVPDGNSARGVIDGQILEWLISDYKLPDSDGLEILRLVRETHKDVNMILMTAYGSAEIERRAIEVGAVYLPKPFEISRIIEIISKNSLQTP